AATTRSPPLCQCTGNPRAPPSFPARRSSDLIDSNPDPGRLPHDSSADSYTSDGINPISSTIPTGAMSEPSIAVTVGGSATISVPDAGTTTRSRYNVVRASNSGDASTNLRTVCSSRNEPASVGPISGMKPPGVAVSNARNNAAAAIAVDFDIPPGATPTA